MYSLLEDSPEAEPVIPEAADALGLLRAVYANPAIPLNTRIRCAALAVPFESPKLAVNANISADDLGERLQRARQRLAQASPLRSAPMIEHEASPQSSPSPFALNAIPDKRFKR